MAVGGSATRITRQANSKEVAFHIAYMNVMSLRAGKCGAPPAGRGGGKGCRERRAAGRLQRTAAWRAGYARAARGGAGQTTKRRRPDLRRDAGVARVRARNEPRARNPENVAAVRSLGFYSVLPTHNTPHVHSRRPLLVTPLALPVQSLPPPGARTACPLVSNARDDDSPLAHMEQLARPRRAVAPSPSALVVCSHTSVPIRVRSARTAYNGGRSGAAGNTRHAYANAAPASPATTLQNLGARLQVPCSRAAGAGEIRTKKEKRGNRR